jgi:hypothetical protein
MGVDVDQSRSNDLAARVDRLGGVARDVGLDRDDLAAGNRNVADRVEPSRGVDDCCTTVGVMERRNRGEYFLFAATLSLGLMRVPPVAPRFLNRSVAETTVTL